METPQKRREKEVEILEKLVNYGVTTIMHFREQRGSYVIQADHDDGEEKYEVSIRVNFQDKDYPNALVIKNMIVTPHALSRRGHGGQVIENLLLWAKDVGITEIYAPEVKENSVGFWIKHGFERMEEPNPNGDYKYCPVKEVEDTSVE